MNNHFTIMIKNKNFSFFNQIYIINFFNQYNISLTNHRQHRFRTNSNCKIFKITTN